MIAARDQPRHARGLGIDVARHRHVALGASGGIAALAGMLYLASVPAGLAPGAFDSTRSLDVVALAVVGGLGSALGAAVGAGALLLAGAVLPSPWGSVASGAGVLWVVLFFPAGVAGGLTSLRDRVAGLVVPSAASGASLELPPIDVASPMAVSSTARVAGSDTRAALRDATVRPSLVAAFAIAGPSLAALFGAPSLLRDHLGLDAGRVAPWLVLGLTTISVVAATIGWQRWTEGASDLPIAAVGVAALAAFVLTDDAAMVSAVSLAGPPLAGWTLARAVRRAARAVEAPLRSAACGLVVACGCGGLLAAAHLAAVAAGNGLVDTARWALAYLVVGAAALATADKRRAPMRPAEHTPGDVARGGRRRWTALRIDRLTVDLGGQHILSGVSVDVQPGQLVALVGANGSGKSTLLRAVAGFVDAAGGRIDVGGEDLTGLRPHERTAAGVAFVDGSHPVFPDLSVGENLRVGAYLTHRTASSFTDALDHVLAVMPQMATRLETRAGLLSGGEQRQLAVAQTLFRRPVVLLADELGLGLDQPSQHLVSRLLRGLADDGIAVVAVDHDVDALLAVADRTIAVRDGGLVEIDGKDRSPSGVRDLVPASFLGRADQ